LDCLFDCLLGKYIFFVILANFLVGEKFKNPTFVKLLVGD
jgi:hypothetical protein